MSVEASREAKKVPRARPLRPRRFGYAPVKAVDPVAKTVKVGWLVRLGKLRQKYGWSKGQAEREVDQWSSRYQS